MNILITGDFFVSDDRRNTRLFDKKILDLFHSADYRITNLESPMCDAGNKIIKTGPYLRSSPLTAIPYLKELEINLVTLANNHISDYGKAGLATTIDTLNKNDIHYVGAGMDKSEAQENYIIQHDKHKIAIVNIAENEWASAGDASSGANPMDIIDNVQQIKRAKDNADFVIAIIHGGHEYFHFPSPRMIKQYRFYAENGASAIVCHHAHCISGYEVYKNVPIFYGLGNFIFTMPSKFDSWYVGLVLQLAITSNSSIEFELHPIICDKHTHTVDILTGADKDKVMEGVVHYSKIIRNESLMEKTWNQFLNEKTEQYLRPFAMTDYFPNRYVRAGLSRLHLNRFFISKRHIKMALNFMRCEAHAEATKEILFRYLVKKSK